MTNTQPIRFTLTDGTGVIVRKVTDIKYDFELKLLNGNRKTFVWSYDMPQYVENKGGVDKIASEAITTFRTITGAVI